jgi:hypothetical protein
MSNLSVSTPSPSNHSIMFGLVTCHKCEAEENNPTNHSIMFALSSDWCCGIQLLTI